jgi:multiple sugar transport system permease protein
MTRRTRRRLGGAARYAVLGLWLVIVLFPLFWSVMTSLKPPYEWFTWPPTWIPNPFTLNNYRVAWFGELLDTQYVQSASIQTPFHALVNSVFIAGTSTALSVALGLLLAYGASRYGILSERTLFRFLMLRMIPPIVVAVPILIFYATLGLLDSYLGLITIYVVSTLPYSLWMTKSFIDEIPIEIEQAAELFGASRLRTLGEVVLPLIRSGVVATFLFILILTWSEYLMAVTLSATKISTLPVQLSKYEGATEGRLYGWQQAMAIGVTVPLIAIGYAIHRHLVRGFSFGMLKR